MYKMKLAVQNNHKGDVLVDMFDVWYVRKNA